MRLWLLFACLVGGAELDQKRWSLLEHGPSLLDLIPHRSARNRSAKEVPGCDPASGDDCQPTTTSGEVDQEGTGLEDALLGVSAKQDPGCDPDSGDDCQPTSVLLGVRGNSYSLRTLDTNTCGSYAYNWNATECEALVGEGDIAAFSSVDKSDEPKGCYRTCTTSSLDGCDEADSNVYFNTHATGARKNLSAPMCADYPLCDAGEYRNSSDVCVDCSAGFYTADASNATSCHRCADLTFQDEAGQSECEACPSGYFWDTSNPTACVQSSSLLSAESASGEVPRVHDPGCAPFHCEITDEMIRSIKEDHDRVEPFLSTWAAANENAQASRLGLESAVVDWAAKQFGLAPPAAQAMKRVKNTGPPDGGIPLEYFIGKWAREQFPDHLDAVSRVKVAGLSRGGDVVALVPADEYVVMWAQAQAKELARVEAATGIGADAKVPVEPYLAKWATRQFGFSQSAQQLKELIQDHVAIEPFLANWAQKALQTRYEIQAHPGANPEKKI